jgi:glycine/D-amino acid oxidase-like deaminating enzyme/nitrite reductase/ring-hydroxylating ferredoxin subunit
MTSLWLDGHVPTEPALEPPVRRFDDVVIGAGITGLSTALMLAQAGHAVGVIDARFPGAVATGNSTAKVSLLQGTRLSQIARNHSDRVVRAYVGANRDGQRWLDDFCRTAGVTVDRRDAITYAGTPDATAAVDREFSVARVACMHVDRVASIDVPFPAFGAVVLADQFQLNPIELVSSLVTALESLGVVILSGTTVTNVRAGTPCTLDTTAGEFEADDVVLATGTPFLDRGLYFAKLTATRSYALAFEVPGEVPADMYLSADRPTRSVRTAVVDGRSLLLVGGNGHAVGRHPSPASRLDDLRNWALEYFPGAVETHAWSAQDYSADNEIPFVGHLPRGRGRISLATGFDKWGMTNGPAAALRIVSEILRRKTLPWAKVLGRRMTVPADLAEGILEGSRVAKNAVTGWVGAISTPVADATAEGSGAVGILDGVPVGVSTVDGSTCRVSAVCPHLGGVVTWNDQERSWDCPLHGSRFAATGERLEGPATRGLTRVESG